MKSKLLPLFFAIAIVTGLMFLGGMILRGNIDKTARKTLHEMGFENPVMNPPFLTFNQAMFKNVALDDEGFSKIDYILITFSPLEALLSGRPKQVELIGAAFTGEVSENGVITMAGWDALKSQPDTLLAGDTVFKIRNSTFTLMTKQFGGVSLALDLQARPENEATQIQGTISSHQKYLGFDAKLSGTVSMQNLWQMDVDISQGEFDLPGARASRISSEVKITNTPSQGFSILGKIDAGAMALYDLAWHNVSATFEQTGTQKKLFVSGKSLGETGLDISLQLDSAAPDPFTGIISAPDIDKFFSYLATQNFVFERPKEFDRLKDLKDIDLEFIVKNGANLGEKEINYNIKNYEKEIDIKGKIILTD